MATWKELEDEKRRLQNRAEARREIKIIGRKRQVLQKEIYELKHPRRTAFVKGARKFGSSVAVSVNKAAEAYMRKQRAKPKMVMRKPHVRRRAQPKQRSFSDMMYG